MRREDWLARLEALVRDRQHREFAWGTFDCCTFAAEAVEAVTGTYPVPGLPGAYDTRMGALRWLAERGFANLEAALDAFAGERLAWPLMARRGDIVLVNDMTVGVVHPAGGVIACLSADAPGLALVSPRLATAAWGS
ncbi:hypothetical protein [uncultured Alsobacter sp.]|uniref:DUF6950 family protein n=1 Tax=uncultured Alsobacter sp. TaxID=1748258 RepID=UPI0025F2B4C3|nr:hypothetical protein [uncultured Alsobacter sp.]